MFLGLRTAVYYVKDMSEARDWYSSILGISPYFDEPFYVGFNVGGFELGLHPDEGKTTGEGQVPYWGVENAETALNRLIELGATAHNNVEDVGGGIKVGAVKDPFGNILGVIENPHFGK
jgi:catechol 2,3-dioxygenase-like lactoylglutathione lyase family enzyme